MDEIQPKSPESLTDVEIDDDSGVEKEIVESNEKTTRPLLPSEIRVGVRTLSLDHLISRIKENELDLHPQLRRETGIWSDVAQSRLIESILVRIPLPSFYFLAIDDTRWLAADGLQRLATIKRFVIDGAFKLTGLEFLDELTGKTYPELPRAFQRRIHETEITAHMIEKGATLDAAFSIFRRINTTARALTGQEIRSVLHQGNAQGILHTLSASDEFKTATDNSIQARGMKAQECVLRFIAFTLTPHREYKDNDLDIFLNKAMTALNKMLIQDIEKLIKRFFRSMTAAHSIFGEFSFRKIRENTTRAPINMALFETWAVSLGRLTDEQITTLNQKKENIREGFIHLMNNADFESALTVNTGDPAKVHFRFACIEKLIQEVLS